jgi:hypothetical protein
MEHTSSMSLDRSQAQFNQNEQAPVFRKAEILVWPLVYSRPTDYFKPYIQIKRPIHAKLPHPVAA